MNAKELREMTVEDLNKKLGELKEELFNLRFQLAINQLDKPHKITEVKHDIARVMIIPFIHPQRTGRESSRYPPRSSADIS